MRGLVESALVSASAEAIASAVPLLASVTSRQMAKVPDTASLALFGGRRWRMTNEKCIREFQLKRKPGINVGRKCLPPLAVALRLSSSSLPKPIDA